MSSTLKLNLQNSFTILHSTFLSFFVSNNFADIFDDKAIFTDRFESLDTPSTAIAGAKNTELQLMFTKYGYYSFQIDLNEIYNNTPLIPVELLCLDTLVHKGTDCYIHRWECLQGP
jgi:hypothetical protein